MVDIFCKLYKEIKLIICIYNEIWYNFVIGNCIIVFLLCRYSFESSSRV